MYAFPINNYQIVYVVIRVFIYSWYRGYMHTNIYMRINILTFLDTYENTHIYTLRYM